MGNIFISKDMYQKIIYYLKSEKKSIKTIIFRKDNIIFSKIKYSTYIHNGINFTKFNSKKFDSSHKFGEYCLTRKPFKYIKRGANKR